MFEWFRCIILKVYHTQPMITEQIIFEGIYTFLKSDMRHVIFFVILDSMAGYIPSNLTGSSAVWILLRGLEAADPNLYGWWNETKSWLREVDTESKIKFSHVGNKLRSRGGQRQDLSKHSTNSQNYGFLFFLGLHEGLWNQELQGINVWYHSCLLLTSEPLGVLGAASIP